MDDARRREEEHRDACWQGCEDLHTCQYCGRTEADCDGDCDCDEACCDDDGDAWADTWQPMPVMDAPDIGLYDPTAVQAVTQDTGGAR